MIIIILIILSLTTHKSSTQGHENLSHNDVVMTIPAGDFAVSEGCMSRAD